MMVAFEAAKEGRIRCRHRGFQMISWGYRKHPKDCGTQPRRHYYRTYQKKSAVIVCNDDKEKPVALKYKWAKEELPIVDCSWGAYIAKAERNGKAQIGKIRWNNHIRQMHQS